MGGPKAHVALRMTTGIINAYQRGAILAKRPVTSRAGVLETAMQAG